ARNGERRPEHERQPVLHRHRRCLSVARRQAHHLRAGVVRDGRRRRDLDGGDGLVRPPPRAGHDPASGAGIGVAGAGTPTGDRRKSQNPPSSAGPIVTANTIVPTPTVPPRANPAASASSSIPARTIPSRTCVRAPTTTIRESRGPAPIQ